MNINNICSNKMAQIMHSQSNASADVLPVSLRDEHCTLTCDQKSILSLGGSSVSLQIHVTKRYIIFPVCSCVGLKYEV